MAAYLGFGVSVNNVIIASILGAPGSLIIAKTLYPETEAISADFDMIKNMPKQLNCYANMKNFIKKFLKKGCL